MQTQAAAPAAARARGSLAAHLHQLKNQHYAAIVSRGELPLRAGVAALLEDCRRDATRLAIVTTTSRCNVEALLVRHLGEAWAALFAAVVCAEDAPRKKPDPQAYELALERLGVPAHATVAIEDSAAGVEAARARAGARRAHAQPLLLGHSRGAGPRLRAIARGSQGLAPAGANCRPRA